MFQLQSRQHFVENSDMYSLRDLMDVAADELLPELASIHASFAQHIKTDCSVSSHAHIRLSFSNHVFEWCYFLVTATVPGFRVVIHYIVFFLLQSCQSKGSKCALCDDKEALFPFDNHAIVCAKCSTVLHRYAPALSKAEKGLISGHMGH